MTGIEDLDETVLKAIQTLRRNEFFKKHVDERFPEITKFGTGWAIGLALVDLAQLALVFMLAYDKDISEHHTQNFIKVADENRQQFRKVFYDLVESLGMDFSRMPLFGNGSLSLGLCAQCGGEVDLIVSECPQCKAPFDILH